jgi:hypothetical protein
MSCQCLDGFETSKGKLEIKLIVINVTPIFSDGLSCVLSEVQEMSDMELTCQFDSDCHLDNSRCIRYNESHDGEVDSEDDFNNSDEISLERQLAESNFTGVCRCKDGAFLNYILMCVFFFLK